MRRCFVFFQFKSAVVLGFALLTLSLGRAYAEDAAPSPSPSPSPSTSPSPSPSPSPSIVSDNTGESAAEAASKNPEYRAILQIYSTGDYDTAIRRLISFEHMFRTSPILASVENLHGMSMLLQKKPVQAIVHFRKAIALAQGQQTFTQYLLYNLATAQFEADQIDDAQDTLMDIHSDLLDRENQIKVHYLRSRLSQKHGLPVEAAQECLLASRLYDSTETQTSRAAGAAADFLDTVLGEISQPSQVEELYKTYENAPFADLPLFRLASLQLRTGNRSEAFSNFKTLISRFPQSPKAGLANQFVHADENAGPADPNTVGVLLPLSGKFAYFGERSLEAIELAFGIFGRLEPDSKITLAIEDSGEDADRAVLALDRLVNEHHAIAVIGPLLSKGIDQVSQRAQEMGVPLISLARASSETSSGNFVFQAGITLQMQAQQIAKYAIQKLGITRFAEIYPREKIGLEAGNYFWDAVNELGGWVVGAESYDSGETDFRQVVDKLSGLYYTEARQRELDELAREREANDIRKRTRKTEQYFSLRPIVDYQAVFIPEETQATGQILPTFAYRDVDSVKFLGTSAWNSEDLVARAQNYAEGAIFTDAFFANSPASESRHFLEAYRSTFGVDPTSKEAISFDAARIVAKTLVSHISSRSDLMTRLEDVKDFNGATGKISYSKGLFVRDLKILTIRNGRIMESATTLGKNGN